MLENNNLGKSYLARILSKAKTNGYESYLNRLKDIFGPTIWLVGGWVRSELFGNENYIGDIDVLTCLSVIDISRKLHENNIDIISNNQGGMRIIMLDGNHIDIFSIEEFGGAGDIKEALSAFNFSINAIAINLKTGQCLFTNQFLNDYSKDILRINPCAYINELNRISMFKDFEVLKNYYRLNPICDSNTNDLVDKLEIEKDKYRNTDFCENMRRAKNKVKSLIPSNTQAWIVRGYIRCALFSELEYWDDIDVIVDTNKSRLVNHLDKLGFSYIWNYYSNPKVILPDGSKIDIWCLSENSSIELEITRYSHNIDGIAWSINEGQLIDPGGALSSIELREINTPASYIENSTEYDISYAAVKTVYLCIRHKLQPKQSSESLLFYKINADGFMSKNCLKLIQELYCLGVDVLERFEALKGTYGSSPAIQLFEKHISPNK